VRFAYSATTEGCTFLLDDDGVCLRVLLRSTRHPAEAADITLAGRTRAQAARRCIGAQYVASIDARVEGSLVPMPRVGVPMLFAYVGEDGRLAVVRTGPLLRFETVAAEQEDIPVDWDDSTGDDDCQTVPLHQSGERRTPDPFDADATAEADPWVPPPRPSWTSLASTPRLQKVTVLGASESAPTLRQVTPPSGKGMLPKKARRR
jgi:hypothetical protein